MSPADTLVKDQLKKYIKPVGIKRCPTCGSTNLAPAGTCHICRICGDTLGACG